MIAYPPCSVLRPPRRSPLPSLALASIRFSVFLSPAGPCRRLVDAVGGSRLQKILQSIEGPVAKIIAVIIIIVDRPDPRVRRYVRRLSPADPDRVRPVDRLRERRASSCRSSRFGGGALI